MPSQRDAVGSAKLSKMCCLLLYVCALAKRKDSPNQKAVGKRVFSVYMGCSSNPKADISTVDGHPWHDIQNAKFRVSLLVELLGPEVL